MLRATLATGLGFAVASTVLAVPPIASVASVAHAAPAPAGARAAQVPITGFAYGGWSRASLARDAHALATVTVDGVGLLADGSAVRRPDRSSVGLGRAARGHGLHTELLVHNYSSEIGDFDPRRAHLLLADPEAIARVSTQLARLVRQGGWDGVNVDLELVPEGDAAGLVALCEALQEAMPDDRTVTIDISASSSLKDYRERGYDLAGIAGAVDRIELMAYDQHGPGWSAPGPIGGLSWQRRAVAVMRRVVPADTIDLGTAGYGYAWRRGGDSGWTVSPGLARARAREAGVRPVWHPRAGEWSARLPGGTVLWWADGRSLRLRLALTREIGVHGLALWRLGSADPLP